ncbi:hypothetical protein GCM10027075_57270 [Streptomyces heilongjiangensis]
MRGPLMSWTDPVGKVGKFRAEDGPLVIWLRGGSVLAGVALDDIDELIIKTYPVVPGTGGCRCSAPASTSPSAR